MNIRTLYILLLIFFPVFLIAQGTSTETLRINGQLFYMHTIKEGETLESIARVYNMSPIDVEENNPTILATGNLKPGMRIRLPDLSNISKDYPISQYDFVYYQVKSQNKLKDIAKEYNVDVKDIKKNNPGISNKPAFLTKIRIPLKKGSKEALAQANNQPSSAQTTENNRETNPALNYNWSTNNHELSGTSVNTSDKTKDRGNCRKQSYNPRNQSFQITYLLPLQLSETSKKDYSYISFLEGALLAIERLKIEGFSATINIEDTYDNASLNKALEKKSLENSDLIIGPFALTHLRSVSNFSKIKNIPMVSPYSNRSEILAKENPNFFQIYPAKDYIDRELFQHSSKLGNKNAVLVYPSNPDTTALKIYRNELKKAFTVFTEYQHVMGLRPEKMRSSISPVLQTDTPNLLFIASDDEAFVSDILDRLMILNTNKLNYPISIFGNSQWIRNFKNLNLANYYSLNMHTVQTFYIDYEREEVKEFISNYRQTYSNEPSQYAFQGYDVTYYFLSALRDYGTDFVDCLKDYETELLQSKYKFKKIYGENGGYVNTDLFFLEYTPDMNIIAH